LKTAVPRNGLLIHPQWKWVNDLVSLMAMALCVTGVMRWIRHPSFICRDFGFSRRAGPGGRGETK